MPTLNPGKRGTSTFYVHCRIGRVVDEDRTVQGGETVAQDAGKVLGRVPFGHLVLETGLGKGVKKGGKESTSR